MDSTTHQTPILVSSTILDTDHATFTNHMTKIINIEPDVAEVLKNAEITATSIKLIGKLDQKLYVKVNKLIELSGGKWNRKAQCHTFQNDPRESLGIAIEQGQLDTNKLDYAAIESTIANGMQGKVIPNFFPTPAPIADQLVQLAEIQPNDNILEPSAGTGNIIEAILRTKIPCNITAVENNSILVGQLHKVYGTTVDIHSRDFLDFGAEHGAYDRIIMNPPFERASDIKHIHHAKTLLKPKGKLVSICSTGPRQIEQIRPMADNWIDIPPKAFKNEGTNIKTAIVVFTK